jgi:hypothetical protein
MATIILIGCSAKKSCVPAPARDFYQGALFKESLTYAGLLKPKAIFVLSAKYHLVPLNKKLTPYDASLNTMPAEERKAWARKVLGALQKETNTEKDTFIILAGKKYYQYLIPHLINNKLPLAYMRIGKQIQWLKNKSNR